jgi:mannitol-1-/sugar-/sorbitol-6-phosphatase
MASSIDSSPVLIRCKGILFDMDGVLISSLGSVERSWTKWANMRGVDPSDACRVAHGCRSIDTVAKLRPDLDAETENRIIEDIEIEDTEGVKVLPGVLKLIAALPKSSWTVVTSATDPLARVRLGAGGVPIPERIVTAETVGHGKPHPDPYLAGAALLGLAPEECVVFEDAASGTKSARAAGCTVVATTFSHSIESLADAHYLIPDLTAVEAAHIPGNDDLLLKLTPIEN